MKKPRHNRQSTAPVSRQHENQNHSVQQTNVVSAQWAGPLPPPAVLEAFERIVPGGAERIFAQFEAEGKHRRELEQRQSKFLVRDVHIGQFMAGLYAMGGLGVTVLAIYLDKPWAAVVIGGLTIGPIVFAFLRQAWTEEKGG